MGDNPKNPKIEDLLGELRNTGYEEPSIEQLEPELRTTKITGPTSYGLPAFNLDQAVEAYAKGKLLDVARKVTQPDENEALIKKQKEPFKKGPRPLGMVLSWRAKQSWYSLTQQQREAYWAHLYDAMEACEKEGSKFCGKYLCSFTSDYEYFTIWEHKDIAGAEIMVMRLDALDFARYFEVKYLVGRAQPWLKTV